MNAVTANGFSGKTAQFSRLHFNDAQCCNGALILGLLSLLLPSEAHADVYIGILFYFWYPFAWLQLITIILIEAYIMQRAGFTPSSSLKASAIANLWSAFIGYPLPLFLYVYTGHTVEGWNMAGPHIDGPDGPAIGNLTALATLVPCFFLSFIIENWRLKKRFRDTSAAEINRLCFKANLASYLFLALFPISSLAGIFFKKL